jgi:hypothetical protein
VSECCTEKILDGSICASCGYLHCEICGTPLVGYHFNARICSSDDCARERHNRYGRKRYALNGEKIKEQWRLNRLKNLDRHRQMTRQWRDNNIEKVNASARKWRIENPEKVRAIRAAYIEKIGVAIYKKRANEKSKKWAKNHPESIRAAYRKWRENNAEHRRNYQRKKGKEDRAIVRAVRKLQKQGEQPS